MNSSRKLTQLLPQLQESMILDLFAWLLVLARHDLSLEIQLENRSTYLACAIHLVIVLQGRIEQWNSRSLAKCLRESVESVHPVSFLSYLHKARRNFLVYRRAPSQGESFLSKRVWCVGFQKAPLLQNLFIFVLWYSDTLWVSKRKGGKFLQVFNVK
jgi:hypothetical protein